MTQPSATPADSPNSSTAAVTAASPATVTASSAAAATASTASSIAASTAGGRTSCLRFGIPDLDILLGASSSGKPRVNGLYFKASSTTSLCLIGPDGSGKTVLALHLAARYLHDQLRVARAMPPRAGTADAGAAPRDPIAKLTYPRIIYASVDLSYEKALETIRHFMLDQLAVRDKKLYQRRPGSDDPKLNLSQPAISQLPLDLYSLVDDKSVAAFAVQEPLGEDRLKIGFLDLQPKTAGDPWNYLRRVLALLQQDRNRRRNGTRMPPALLIVDSTDGLFTLSGGLDAYGETRNRDARVSQLLGAARDTAHLVLLVGAAVADERPAEAFLTDCVVRLRVLEEAGYQSRSVDVEKVRAQASVSGKHRFSIRSGAGSSTGRQQNPDDPRFVAGPQEGQREVAYLRVFHSIDFLDSYEREIPDAHRDDREPIYREFTGIEFLDSMLPVRQKRDLSLRFPLGNVTAIIGSAKTFKSNIGRAFLARGIFPVSTDAAEATRLDKWIQATADRIRRHVYTAPTVESHYQGFDYELVRDITGSWDPAPSGARGPASTAPGIGILLTTDDLRPERTAKLLREWASPQLQTRKGRGLEELIFSDWIESRMICRRLEVHTIYPEGLVHIVLRCIYEARRRLGIPSDDTLESRAASGRIRLVIDDWNTIGQIYPAIARDSKCLQFLLREIRRLGVTALIVNSQALSPGQLLSGGSGNNLVPESNVIFTTWPVAFRGARLAAVCVGETARTSEPTIVREIRNRKDSDERIIVDPHLELYRGLLAEETEPEPVPLRVCLLDEDHAGTEYLERTSALFRELFAPIRGQDRSVVETVGCGVSVHTSYEQMRAVSYFQTGSLDHTLILLLDEFWGIRSHRSLLPLTDYFEAETRCQDDEVRLLRDPHELFQRRADGIGGTRRKEFFETELFTAARLPSGWAPLNTASTYQPPLPGMAARPSQEATDVHASLDAADATADATAADAAVAIGEAGMLRDRVPYSWDFAFLTCRLRAWENAQPRHVDVWDVRGTSVGIPFGGRVTATVREVWDRLDRRQNPLLPLHNRNLGAVDTESHPNAPVAVDLCSWRWFLGAAAMVAKSDNLFASKEIIAFDFHAAGPESLGSWILEVWASEIVRTIERNEWLVANGHLNANRLPGEYYGRQDAFLQWARGETGDREGQGLLAWLGATGQSSWEAVLGHTPDYYQLLGRDGWVIELYKTLRMLCGFIHDMGWMEEQQPWRFMPHSPAPGAVAVRHYYKTAAAGREQFKHEDPTVALPLPGRFSTRGDLALGIARGSRSVRLGERSIDKLCSRAGNEIRLETGVGLPVRKMAPAERAALVTRMVTVDRFAEQAQNDQQYYPPTYVRPLRYTELLRTAPCAERQSYWLWRGRLDNYDSQSTVWHKWLFSVLEEFLRIRRGRGAVWVEALDAYDQLEKWQCGLDREGKPSTEAPKLTTYQRFGPWCDRLIARLQSATQS